MSDTRFTIFGIGLIFGGFIILGIFGSQFSSYNIEAEEFGDCFEYSEDAPPKKVDCDIKIQDKLMLVTIVTGFIVSGIILLIKGVRGRWDQDVKPEDMLGPGNPKSD